MTTLAKPERAAVLFALLVMLLASMAMGRLFVRFRQPRVVGEILGGVVLGPTVLGALWPGAYEYLFQHTDASASALAFIAWLGLTLLMFQSGIETRDMIDRPLWKRVAAITAVGTAVPLLAGYGLGQALDFSAFYGPQARRETFGIFLGMAIAVTAIPVLSRILMDLGLLGSSFGKTVMGVALIEDLVLWAGLAVLLNLGGVSGGGFWSAPAAVAITLGGFWSAPAAVAVTLGFFAVCYVWGHRAAILLSRAPVLRSASDETVAFVCLLVTMLLGYLLGVRMIFGAFLGGRIVARAFPDRSFSGAGLGFLVTIFFASVGVRVDLSHGFDALALVAITLLALGIKTAATWVGSRLGGVAFWPSVHLSVVLNARGALGIVLATIGFEAEIINGKAFATLILLAVVSSMVAGTWLQWVHRRNPEQLGLDGASPEGEAIVIEPAVPAPLVEAGSPTREGYTESR